MHPTRDRFAPASIRRDVSYEPEARAAILADFKELVFLNTALRYLRIAPS